MVGVSESLRFPGAIVTGVGKDHEYDDDDLSTHRLEARGPRTRSPGAWALCRTTGCSVRSSATTSWPATRVSATSTWICHARCEGTTSRWSAAVPVPVCGCTVPRSAGTVCSRPRSARWCPTACRACGARRSRRPRRRRPTTWTRRHRRRPCSTAACWLRPRLGCSTAVCTTSSLRRRYESGVTTTTTVSAAASAAAAAVAHDDGCSGGVSTDTHHTHAYKSVTTRRQAWKKN